MYAGHAPLANFELAELPPFSRILINFVCIVDTAKNPEARPQWPRQQRFIEKHCNAKTLGNPRCFYEFALRSGQQQPQRFYFASSYAVKHMIGDRGAIGERFSDMGAEQ